MGDQVSVE